MKRKKVDSNLERQFLTAMIVSKPFLAVAAPTIEVDLLETRYFQQVAGWCKAFFESHGNAPGRSIEAMYHAWVENEKPDEADAESVLDFLESLSSAHDEGVEVNVPYLLEEFGKYMTLRRVSRLKDLLDSSLTYGQVDEAVTAVQNFRSVDTGDGHGYDPTKDRAAVARAFAEPPESIIQFPGDAGLFFGDALTRDALIGIQGPEKRGKTWWCLEFMYRAVRSGRTCAMFQVGDLSEAQLSRRWFVRMANNPLTQRWCKGVRLPQTIEVVDGDDGKVAQVQHITRDYAQPLTERMARRAQRKFCRTHRIPEDKTRVMFSIHANSSINVKGIDGILQRWRHEKNFVPDVIVIDYADILAPEDPRAEHRHQVNATWKALRRLSQDWHACVLAPTQADAASYDVKTQSAKNFSEDKRKYAHVTGMLGLNQTPEEKEDAVMRLNWIVLRESEFDPRRCLWVAQCLPLAQAFSKGVLG